MTTLAKRPRTGPAVLVGIIVALEAITFLLASLTHWGVPVPLGFTEPPILPAAIVEGLIGLFLAVAVYALLTRRTWAWPAATASHLVGIFGVLLGLFATTVGPGPATEANAIYHRVILLVLVLVLTYLLLPAGRAALGRRREVPGAD